MPETDLETRRSYLHLIDRIDSFPYYQRNPAKYNAYMKDYYYFMIEGYPTPFGYVHRTKMKNITWGPSWHIDHATHFLTLRGANTFKLRSDLMRQTLWDAHKEGRLGRLKNWDEEMYPVYSGVGEYVFDMRLLGSSIFGTVCSRVSLIVWTGNGAERLYWVQRRAMTKAVFPGKLDSGVGGNLRSGETPFEGMVREANEEAGIPRPFAKANLKAGGTISYHLDYDSDYTPASCLHILYAYEIELSPDVVPTPNDGEVELFITMSEKEVQDALFEDEFKPIVAVQWLAHFYRDGVMNAENEKHFHEIIARLHRKHDLFVAEAVSSVL